MAVPAGLAAILAQRASVRAGLADAREELTAERERLRRLRGLVDGDVMRDAQLARATHLDEPIPRPPGVAQAAVPVPPRDWSMASLLVMRARQQREQVGHIRRRVTIARRAARAGDKLRRWLRLHARRDCGVRRPWRREYPELPSQARLWVRQLWAFEIAALVPQQRIDVFRDQMQVGRAEIIGGGFRWGAPSVGWRPWLAPLVVPRLQRAAAGAPPEAAPLSPTSEGVEESLPVGWEIPLVGDHVILPPPAPPSPRPTASSASDSSSDIDIVVRMGAALAALRGGGGGGGGAGAGGGCGGGGGGAAGAPLPLQ